MRSYIRNWVMLLLFAVAAIMLELTAGRYLRDTGHTPLCVTLFVILAVVFIYAAGGRASERQRK